MEMPDLISSNAQVHSPNTPSLESHVALLAWDQYLQHVPWLLIFAYKWNVQDEYAHLSGVAHTVI